MLEVRDNMLHTVLGRVLSRMGRVLSVGEQRPLLAIRCISESPGAAFTGQSTGIQLERV